MAKLIFDLDDTLVSGDIVLSVSTKMETVGLLDRVYSNANITSYCLGGLPEPLKERVKQAFADPEYVWIKKPIVGAYYFLYFLCERGHDIGIITARPISTQNETMRFIAARFPKITFRLGINFINKSNQIDMNNMPTKKDMLEKHKPDFYFDDNEEYCTQSNHLGISTYLISNKQTPWNHQFARTLRVTNYSITELRNVAFFPETRL